MDDEEDDEGQTKSTLILGYVFVLTSPEINPFGQGKR
jgi:hypothetical protein